MSIVNECIESYLNSPVDSEQGQECIRILLGQFNENQSSLTDIVNFLGPSLTHKDPFHRAKAVHLMYDVIKRLNSSQISSGEALVLTAFFNDKLADQPSVPPALNALYSLLESGHLNQENQLSIAKKIFAELNVQTYPQGVRNTVFRILAHLLTHSLQVIRTESSEFIVGFIHCLDGEKDPRNLLLAFRMVLKIVQSLNFEPYKEDLFEVVFCYFPITFRAPPDDPHGVTATELKESLRAVVASSSLFAPFSLPVLVEKLTADSASAKRDALDTITSCAPVYDPECWTPHLSAIWNTIRDVVVNGVEEESDSSALRALTALTEAVSRSMVVLSAKSSRPLQDLLEKILKDCLGQLEEPELKYTRPCGKLVQACALGSAEACAHLSGETIPLIIKLLRQENADVRRKILLEILVDLISANRVSIYMSSQTEEAADGIVSVLDNVKSDVFDLVVSFLVVESSYAPLRAYAVKGLQELLSIDNFLSDEQMQIGIQQICRTGFVPLKNASVVDASLVNTSKKALSLLLIQRGDLVLSMALAEFKSNLDESTYKSILDILSSIGKESNAFTPVTNFFMGVVTSTSSTGILSAALSALSVVISQAQDSPSIQKDILYPIFALCKEKPGVTYEKDTHKLIRTCVMKLPLHNQQLLLHDVFDTNHRVALFTMEDEAVIPVSPLALTLIGSILCFLKVNLSEPIPPSLNRVEFLIRLVKFALIHREATDLFEVVGQIIGSLMNKSLRTEEVDAVLTFFEDAAGVSFLQNEQADLNARKGLLHIQIWMTRGLVLKYDQRGYTLLERIVSNLSNPSLGDFSANGFNILFGESDSGVLTKRSFAQVKLLFKQRMYDRCLPLIIEGFKNGPEGCKVHYLLALSFMLKNISKAVLLSELSNLFPLLLHSLSLDSPSLKLATLETMVVMIQELPSLVERHLKSFLDRFLAMAVRNETSSKSRSKVSVPVVSPTSGDIRMSDAPSPSHDPRVRIAAIKAVGLLVDKIPYASLFPYKPSVLEELEKALDDPKRVVRAQAANTRSKWCLLLGPKK